MKTIFKRIMNIGFILIIIIASIFTGNPLAKNDAPIMFVIGFVGIILIVKKIIKKEPIIRDKNMIVMLTLVISSIIPIILKKYITLEGAIYYVYRYACIFLVYILINEIMEVNCKKIDFLFNSIIFSGIIITIIGIDLLTLNISYKFVSQFIGITDNQANLVKLYSVFLYNNTAAIAIIVSYLLSLGQILKNKKYNLALVSASIILIAGAVISQSRISLFLSGILIIFYLILLKDKEDRYKLIKILFVHVLAICLYLPLFSYFKRIGSYFTIPSLIAIAIAFSLVYEALVKNKKINIYIKFKNLCILGIVAIIFVVILMFFKTDLVLFTGKDAPKKIIEAFYNVKPNSDCNIEIDVETISKTEKDNYKIEIIQRNKYMDVITTDEIKLNNYNGKVEKNLYLDEKIYMMEINFIALKTNENTKMIVKSLSIDGKFYVLNYKYLPTDIINQFVNTSFSQKSVWERGTLIKDGFSQIKKCWLFGIGGDAWDYVQPNVQSYNYVIREMHSYPIQLWMEFGLVGISAYVIILIVTFLNIIKIIKRDEKENYSIILVFLCLFFHSLVDIDMTFLYIMILFYMFVAIINFKEKNEIKENKKIFVFDLLVKIAFLLVSAVILYYNICDIYIGQTKDKNIEKCETYEEKTKYEKMYINLIPYRASYKVERADYLELYLKVKSRELTEEQKEDMKQEMVELLLESIKAEKGDRSIIAKCVKILKATEDEEVKNYIYEVIEEKFKNHRYNSNRILEDYQLLKIFKNDEKIIEIMNKNIEKDINYIKDYEKSRILESDANSIIKILEREYKK